MLRRLRILLAIVFFLSLTWLFLDFTGTAHVWLGWMAKLQFLPAILAVNVGVVVLLAVLTIACGRIYCSVICPLGVMQDVISWIAGKCQLDKNKRRFGRFSYSKPRVRNWVRYAILVIFVLCMVAGIGSVVQILAPYSSFGRIMTSLFKPLYEMGNNVLASWSESNDNFMFYRVETRFFSQLAIISLISLACVFGFAWVSGRGYCNNVCPVGSLLGLLSRRSLFGIRIDDSKCKSCGLCARKCKGNAIDPAAHTVDLTRCVDCFDCLDTCKHGALSYGLKTAAPQNPKVTESASSSATDGQNGPTRRAFLTAAGTIALGAALKAEEKTTDGGLATILDKVVPNRNTPLVPPGALSLKNIQQHCTGCQLCVSECPNGILRPSGDLTHFAVPVMSYENGHCRPECHRCSDVCPAGAIVKLEKAYGNKVGEEQEDVEARASIKSSIKIGSAVWVKNNCVVLTDDVNCGNCARHCPSGAIEMVPSDPDNKRSRKIPVVNDERCIGCGACEHLCPARPFSAIYVEGIEVHREI